MRRPPTRPQKSRKPAPKRRRPRRDRATTRNLDAFNPTRPPAQPPTALIWRINTVLRELGITRQTLLNWERNPAVGFPPRYPLSETLYGFARADIFAWLERRRDARLARMPPPDPPVETIPISSTPEPAADPAA